MHTHHALGTYLLRLDFVPDRDWREESWGCAVEYGAVLTEVMFAVSEHQVASSQKAHRRARSQSRSMKGDGLLQRPLSCAPCSVPLTRGAGNIGMTRHDARPRVAKASTANHTTASKLPFPRLYPPHLRFRLEGRNPTVASYLAISFWRGTSPAEFRRTAFPPLRLRIWHTCGRS